MKKIPFITIILATWICYPLLAFLAKKRSDSLEEEVRVLIIPQLTRIGDIVCSTPVFYNIKKSYPESHVSVLVSKKAVGIIKHNKRIDDIIIIEDYSWFGLIWTLRQKRFNWSISLSATSTSTCWAIWALIGHRIKTVVETPPITERMTDWMANHRLVYHNHTYLPHHHIRLLSFMNIKHQEDKKEIWLSGAAEEKIHQWKKRFIDPEMRIIGLSITAGNKIKELGDRTFVEITQHLLNKKGVVVICIGSITDKERIEKFVTTIGDPRCIPATEFNLEELPSLIKICSLYIAVDTGPIYIAHALGIPLIDIIGPVDPKEQPPHDNKSIQILPRNNLKPSSFVFKRRGTPEEIEKAIKLTDINEIVAAAYKLLD